MEVAIYKPDFLESYGKRLTPSTVLEYVKQEYPVDENITEQDIEIHHEGDYARVIIERIKASFDLAALAAGEGSRSGSSAR